MKLGGYSYCMHHEMMMSHVASSFLNGGHLGPPSWISGFVQNLKHPGL